LEAFAGAGLARFFSLLHSRIASKQTLAFQAAAQIGVGLNERPRNGETRCSSLTGDSAATSVNEKIVGVDHLRRLQWLKDHVLQRNARKVIFEVAAVDVDLAGSRSHPNARHGSFST